MGVGAASLRAVFTRRLMCQTVMTALRRPRASSAGVEDDMTAWTCKESSDFRAMRACADRGRRHETWHLDAAFAAADANPADPDRWWFAATDDGGTVGAFAAIHHTRAHLFGDDEDAVEALARALLRSQKLHTSREAHRHVLFGPARVVDPFWRIFRAVDRQVVADRRPTLLCSGEGGKGSRRMGFGVADGDDVKLCLAYFGEHGAEQHGADPRKTRPHAFAQEVAELIAAGRLVVGREQAPGSGAGRAMFVAEVTEIAGLSVEKPAVMLTRWHVPLPFRGRKILVAGALFEAARQGPGAGKQVWLLAEGEPLLLAAARAGYREVLPWREIAMLG